MNSSANWSLVKYFSGNLVICVHSRGESYEIMILSFTHSTMILQSCQHHCVCHTIRNYIFFLNISFTLTVRKILPNIFLSNPA